MLGRRSTPYFEYQKKRQTLTASSLGISGLPRSISRSGLSEGRIRSFFYGLAAAFFALAIAQGSLKFVEAAEQLSIQLKEDAAITSGSIMLKDIADLTGNDSKQIELLSKVVLCPAPIFGETTILSRQQVRGLIQKAMNRAFAVEAFTGASAVQIRVQGRQITSDDIAPLVKAQLMKSEIWNGSEISVRALENLPAVELPPAEGEVRIASLESVLGKDNILVPVEVMCAGKGVRSFWIRAEIGIRAEVLAATKQITPGTTITEAFFEKKLVEIPDLRTEYLRNPEDALGRVARRGFRAGEPLYTEALSEPVLVKSGEMIRLRLERKGIVITSMVKAEQAGRLGQVIRVRNLDFSAVLKAQVTGPAEVRMQ
jgi:flagella basal body P-ring formation protein FlgA